jgi:hypothetical protein
MRKMLFVAAASAALLTVPTIVLAQDPATGAATGAAVGAGVGAVVGGPVGAAIGAGVGGTVGAGAADAERARVEDRVIVEERAPAVRERNCVTNAAGTVCEEIRR